MNKITITKEEQKAIAALKRLAKKWPDSISIFSWSGSLCVFKVFNGKHVNIDSIIGIENDGGDPQIGNGPEDDVWDDGDIEIEFEQ